MTNDPTQSETIERASDDRQVETVDDPLTIQDATKPQDEQINSVTMEGDSSDQRQPYPYHLRPLSVSRNYNSTDHANG